MNLNCDVLFPCPEFLSRHISITPDEKVANEAISLFTSH